MTHDRLPSEVVAKREIHAIGQELPARGRARKSLDELVVLEQHGGSNAYCTLVP